MKSRPIHPSSLRAHRVMGSALAETILSVGLLALILPWIHAAWSAAREELHHAEIEAISGRVTDACLSEVWAANHGFPSLLPQITPGESLPPNGEVWALGFSGGGDLLGRIAPERYQLGCRIDAPSAGEMPIGLAKVEILAAPDLQVENTTAQPSQQPSRINLRITLEYPANQAIGSRRKLPFHTIVP